MWGFCIWAKLLQSTHLICLLVIKLPTSHQQFKSLSERQRLTRNCYAEMLLISLSLARSASWWVADIWEQRWAFLQEMRGTERWENDATGRRGFICKARIYQEWFHTRTASHRLWPSTLVYLDHRKLRLHPSTNANDIFCERPRGQYVNTNLTV